VEIGGGSKKLNGDCGCWGGFLLFGGVGLGWGGGTRVGVIFF